MKLRSRRRSAFTLVEAVVAMSITAMAGTALLLGVGGLLDTTDAVMDQAIAQGIADQLADEIAGKRYTAVGAGAYQWPLGASAYEAGGVNRERYDDIDDYVAVAAEPPNDPWGKMLGTDDGQGGQRHANFCVASTFFARWRFAVSVYYLNANNLSQRLPAGQTSDYRGAEVQVLINDPQVGWRPLATSRRVFAYLPTP